MKKYRAISIIFVIFLFLFLDLGFSQPFGRGMGRGMGMGMGWMGAGYPYAGYSAPGTANLAGYPYANYPNLLNLAQEQINKLNEIQTKFQSENAVLLNSLNQKNLELQNLTIVQPLDQIAINVKIDEISKIQAELQKKVLAYTEDVRNILTEQQKTIVNSNNLGYGWALSPYGGLPYGQGQGLGMAPGYTGGFLPGMQQGMMPGMQGMMPGMQGMMPGMQQGMMPGMQGMGYGGGYYGRNVLGGPRLGRGPCGVGFGKSGALGRVGGWGRLW